MSSQRQLLGPPRLFGRLEYRSTHSFSQLIFQSLLSMVEQNHENKWLLIYDFPMPAAVSWFFKNRYVVSKSFF